MGKLADSDIRALRERLSLSQDQLSDLLGCGKKSLSRWENGREYPSQLVNTLIRLLEEKIVTPADLRSVRGPRLTTLNEIAVPCPQQVICSQKVKCRQTPRTYGR